MCGKEQTRTYRPREWRSTRAIGRDLPSCQLFVSQLGLRGLEMSIPVEFNDLSDFSNNFV